MAPEPQERDERATVTQDFEAAPAPSPPAPAPAPASEPTGFYSPSEPDASGATGVWTEAEAEDRSAPTGPGAPGCTGEDASPGSAKSGEALKPAPARRGPHAGRFVLKKRHAQGGMGEIWLAEDTDIGRQVALKRIRPGREDWRVPFLLEAQVTGQLEHPGVVPVHELGNDEEGRPFYVMKFVHGGTLWDIIHDFHAPAKASTAEKKSSLREAEPHEVQRLRLLQIFIDVCQTMAYAHSRGVLHRDLKPENIMVGPYGETLLLDWGLAKLAGQPDRFEDLPQIPVMASGEYEATRAGRVKGTPDYMPPESVEGQTDLVDHQSDIYLLGATLYHILTGKAPRQVKSIKQLVELVKMPVAPPRKLNPAIPKGLDAICLKAMAPAKADRYASAGELAEDVQRFLAGEPVAAYRESFLERSWRWCRRHRKALGRGLAAVLVVGTAAIAFYKFHQQQRENAERLEQAEQTSRALQAQETAREQIARFRRLAEEARFFAASTNPVAEHAPFFDPAKGEAAGQAALDVTHDWATRWTGGIDGLPLPHEIEPLKRELYDLLLLMAQLESNQPSAQRGTENARRLLGLTEQAGTFGPATRGYHRLRSQAYEALGEPQSAAAERAKADDQQTPAGALDYFLLGEQYRTEASRPSPDAERKPWQPDKDRLGRAIEQYRLALRADPDHFWSHFQLGRCHLAAGKLGEAVESLGACVALRPKSAWGYSARGLALMQLKRYDEAKADLDRAIELDADFLPPRLNRGVVHWLQKDIEAAKADFDAVLNAPADKRLIEAAFYRAQMNLERGNADSALEDLDRVAKETQRLKPVFLMRAQVFFGLGRDGEALADLDSYFGGEGFDPKSAEAFERRGRQIRLIALELAPLQRRHKLRLALSQLTAAVERGGKSASLFEELGMVHEHLGQIEEGINAYTEAVKLAPKGVKILVKRGWAYEKLQELDKALADFRAAVEIDPNHPEAHTGLGYVQAGRNESANARRHAHQAILFGAGDYLILHNVACIYGKLSQTLPQQSAEYEDLVLDQLKQAVALWKRDRSGPNELQLIEAEPAFTPAIRAKPEFRRLIAED